MGKLCALKAGADECSTVVPAAAGPASACSPDQIQTMIREACFMLNMCRWSLTSKPELDWKLMMEREHKELDRLSSTYQKQLESNGVKFIEGRGKVTGKNSIEVAGKSYTVSLSSTLTQDPAQHPPHLEVPSGGCYLEVL